MQATLAPGSLFTFPLFFTNCATTISYFSNGDGSGEINLIRATCGPGGITDDYIYLMTIANAPRPGAQARVAKGSITRTVPPKQTAAR